MTRPPVGQRAAIGLGVFLVGAGVAHFVVPQYYRQLIPPWLGAPDAWVYGSGVVEIAVGAAIIPLRTRRRAAFTAALLFIAVFPGNIFHAWQARDGSSVEQVATLIRLPLQLPLIWWAWRVAKNAGGPDE
ncbi:MAG: hypothetical protein ABI586_04975 [Candidatus Nanopelagicales bacterium]